MTDTRDTLPGLPPGLWLPTAQEDTNRFKTENFKRADLEHEDLVEYGMFITALAMFDETRVSKMPTGKDFNDLAEAGFGINVNRLNKVYDGLGPIVTEMGFYPRGYKPSREQLIERYQWVADFALPKEDTAKKAEFVRAQDYIIWASERNFAPGIQTAREVLGEAACEVSLIFGTSTRGAVLGITHRDLFGLGKRIIAENDERPPIAEVEERYGSELPARVEYAMNHVSGGVTSFWADVDKGVGIKPPFTPDKVLDGAARYMLRNGRQKFTREKLDELSSRNEFFSGKIADHFDGSLRALQTAMNTRMDEVDKVRDRYLRRGISEEAFVALTSDFEYSDEYLRSLKSRLRVMLALSEDSEASEYIMKFLNREYELDFESDEIYTTQLEWIFIFADRLKLKSYDDLAILFNAIPCVDFHEAIKDSGRVVVESKGKDKKPMRLKKPMIPEGA